MHTIAIIQGQGFSPPMSLKVPLSLHLCICGSLCVFLDVRAHLWVYKHTNNSECWRFNSWSQKASFEGNHHFGVSFKASNRSSPFNSWISHTSHEMMVSPVERHGAGIKGMDQLSTVTTRTQLQRIHIRSQSLRVMLSPPPLKFIYLFFANTHTPTEYTEKTHISKRCENI